MRGDTIAPGEKQSSGAAPHFRLIDMHCHLDRMTNGLDVAAEVAERGIAIFCTTVTPGDALLAQELFGNRENVRVGVGLHPWWVDDERPSHGARSNHIIEQAAAMAAQSNYIGEIGLDFSPARAQSAAAQLATFEQIVRACADHPRDGRVISLHAVRSASAALDVLERHDLPRQAAYIFHWFSGTSEDLVRLRRLGCYVSVNDRMLATRRGREYARQMPTERLLLETDAPQRLDTPCTAAQIEESLECTVRELAHLRKVDERELAACIAQTSAGLLKL